jgi:hypothetical protein
MYFYVGVPNIKALKIHVENIYNDDIPYKWSIYTSCYSNVKMKAP